MKLTTLASERVENHITPTVLDVLVRIILASIFYVWYFSFHYLSQNTEFEGLIPRRSEENKEERGNWKWVKGY